MEEDWGERLGDAIEPDLGRQIDIFETDMELKLQGRIDDRLFSEKRLRRGAYGQRYDNGKRHDGVRTREIAFPSTATKGVDTAWDALGMMRIKLPMGRMSADQLDVLAEVAEEYSTSVLHITTRQDIQLHHIHIEDTPSLMRRLAAVGVTTQEACGNVVRNVTACPTAGVCGGEAFDITPYADALTRFLLGHDDTQDFGRKFKIAFSGCRSEACGLVNFHDLGVLATLVPDAHGVPQRRFEIYVGGGLGAVPRPAQRLGDTWHPDELLPLAQAISRVFATHGERKNRTRARLKFLIAKLGIEAFTELVLAERDALPEDERWTLPDADMLAMDGPLKPGAPLASPATGPLARWIASNVKPQRQEGYVTATLRLSLGDLTSDQARGLADLMRTFTGDTLRASVEQNLVLRWVSEADLPALYEGLSAIRLHGAGANTIADITSCPGTDTCKLGISSSRGLSAELQDRLNARLEALHPDAAELRIKVSGCFNSCGQHHVADIGFLGVNRTVDGRRVPHFQLVVGGQWRNNGGAYGMPVAAYPARRAPEVVDALITTWLEQREENEPFVDFVPRAGRSLLKKTLAPLQHVPAYDEDASFYTDWGDAREYTIGDKGVGECAGELVTATAFGLQAAERRIFEGQLDYDRGEHASAATAAYDAMVGAARTLVKIKDANIGRDPDAIVDAFREKYHETGVFHDRYAGGKFAVYLLKTHANPPVAPTAEEARRHLEEATLFVEAAQAAFVRLQDTPVEKSA